MTEQNSQNVVSPPTRFIGVYFPSKTAHENFFRIMCPCGVVAYFAANALPDKTTPHNCGHPEHFSVVVEGP